MAEDIVGLLDHLDIGKAAVIGHSLGGMVAYHLAANHQDRVEALVLEDPPPPLPLARPALVQDDSTGFDWAMMRETEGQFVAPDSGWAAGMQRITAPTLVVGGGESSPVRAEQTAALIPEAKLVVIDVGHLIHVAAPEEFLAVVEPFLDSARRPERLGRPS
jgi:3-oxoadipate enol-lactonase